jgi:hypothetical protein
MEVVEIEVADSAGIMAGTQDVRAILDFIDTCACPVLGHFPDAVQRFLSVSPSWSLTKPRHMYVQGVPEPAVLRWLNETEPDFTSKNQNALELYLAGGRAGDSFYDENWATVRDSQSTTLVVQNMYLQRVSAGGPWSHAHYDVFVGQMDLTSMSPCGCATDLDTVGRATDLMLQRLRAESPREVLRLP